MSYLQVRHSRWSVQVSFSTVTVVQLTIIAHKDTSSRVRRVSGFVKALEIAVKRLKIGSLNTGGSAGEAAIDDFISETNSLKHLWKKDFGNKGEISFCHTYI
jgi:hypothetical protein